MSDRLLVATRKGLLMFERRGGGWALARTAFRRGAGDGGACATARRHALCRAQARPFRPQAAPLRRRRRNLAASCRRRPFRPTRPARPTLFQIWTLEAGGPHHPGRLWIGAHAGRPVPLRRPRRELAAHARALGRAGARANGSAAAMTMPASIRCRPIRAIRRASSSRSPAAACGTRGDDGASWTLRGEGLVAAYMPPEQAGSARDPGPASRRALRRRRPT